MRSSLCLRTPCVVHRGSRLRPRQLRRPAYDARYRRIGPGSSSRPMPPERRGSTVRRDDCRSTRPAIDPGEPLPARRCDRRRRLGNFARRRLRRGAGRRPRPASPISSCSCSRRCLSSFGGGGPLAVVLVVLGALLVQLAILPAGCRAALESRPAVALYTAGEQLERRLPIGILVGFGVVLAALVLGRRASRTDCNRSSRRVFFVVAGSSAMRPGSAGSTRGREKSRSGSSNRSGRAGARSAGASSPESFTTRSRTTSASSSSRPVALYAGAGHAAGRGTRGPRSNRCDRAPCA